MLAILRMHDSREHDTSNYSVMHMFDVVVGLSITMALVLVIVFKLKRFSTRLSAVEAVVAKLPATA